MSQASWLVAGIVPGIERHPLKKLEPSEVELLRLFMRWRAEATQKGRTITRIAVTFEAGRDGFWLARWLRARDIKAGSCWVSGWWVWVVRSEGIWCDGWSASSQPARARSFCHHGCTDLVNLSGLLDDAKCFAFVRQHRWPEGVRCPGCGSGAVIRDGCDDTQPHRQRYRCKACA